MSEKLPGPVDCEYTKEIVCPYCGEEHDKSWENWMLDNPSGTFGCSYCDKDFFFSAHIEVTYSTEKMKTEEDKK